MPRKSSQRLPPKRSQARLVRSPGDANQTTVDVLPVSSAIYDVLLFRMFNLSTVLMFCSKSAALLSCSNQLLLILLANVLFANEEAEAQEACVRSFGAVKTSVARRGVRTRARLKRDTSNDDSLSSDIEVIAHRVRSSTKSSIYSFH